jgi:hypothetical protein
MKTYKLFRVKNGKLYPLYVEANKEIITGEWLKSGCGELTDETHVKASGCGGKLSLRSGYHSTTIPFTDWIGKKMPDGTLAQKANTVWCECEVRGTEVECTERNGFRRVPEDSWYYFRTNSKQVDPWIISDWIKVNKILSYEEVCEVCKANGRVAQKLA